MDAPLLQSFSGQGRGCITTRRRTAVCMLARRAIAPQRRKNDSCKTNRNIVHFTKAGNAGQWAPPEWVALFSVLAALMLTLLLEALDQTVVGTALPRIIGSLQGFDRYTRRYVSWLRLRNHPIRKRGKLS